MHAASFGVPAEFPGGGMKPGDLVSWEANRRTQTGILLGKQQEADNPAWDFMEILHKGEIVLMYACALTVVQSSSHTGIGWNHGTR